MNVFLLLLVLVILEAVLAAYRIKTQCMQQSVTAIVRGATILMLVALSALSIITWGFRYYAIGAVLVVSVVVNAIQILRTKGIAKKCQSSRIIWKAVRMLALAFIALSPALIFPEYQPLPTTGEYRVATLTKHYADESRIEAYAKHGGARTLAAEFWYPSDTEGDFPLIVFSHGSFGTRTSNETLYRELASHGYVVCSIDHTYQCFYTTDKYGNVLLMNSEYVDEIRRENAKEDKLNSLQLYRKWMDVRVTDINFVIDAMTADLTNPDATNFLYSLINFNKIGVMGHSLGGSAALGVGRMRSDIGAVIALEAPFMCDILDVENGEFVFEAAAYPAPVLNVYSGGSWSHLGEWPQYGKNMQMLSESEKNTYNLHIAGVGHLSLTDLSLASPLLTRILNGHASSVSAEDCLRQINNACLAFFDDFLKGQGRLTHD